MKRSEWVSACSAGSCVEVAWQSACASGNCVEVGWQSACGTGSCVEVSHQDDRVLVRDGKDPDGPVLEYGRDEWQREVLEEIKEGGWLPDYSYREADETVVMRRDPLGAELRFTPREWDEFLEGVQAGRFSIEEQASG